MKKSITLRKKYHFKFKNSLNFKKHLLKWGTLGFKLKKTVCISEMQEMSIKLILIKYLKKITLKKFKLFFNSKCFYSATKLPLESRMGKGKGEICHFFGYYKKGYILFELKNISLFQALKLQNQLNKNKILKIKIIY
uniref:Ribosomal protein L16 n=1 Tax=Pterosiphonia complanata TaxID=884089 RepID=UPI0022FD411F|nr:Ribosomal protein L16 [Pterosiphonia complanata]WAX04088.1 Ribosomal protein L16 [Pterosiphonia complanata]